MQHLGYYVSNDSPRGYAPLGVAITAGRSCSSCSTCCCCCSSSGGDSGGSGGSGGSGN